MFCPEEEEKFKAIATVSALNTAGPVRQAQLSVGRRGGGRGRAGLGGLGWTRRAGGRAGVQIRQQTALTPPAFRPASDLISLESTEVSSEEEQEEEEENYFGFGRCFRCGESGSNKPSIYY